MNLQEWYQQEKSKSYFKSLIDCEVVKFIKGGKMTICDFKADRLYNFVSKNGSLVFGRADKIKGSLGYSLTIYVKEAE